MASTLITSDLQTRLLSFAQNSNVRLNQKTKAIEVQVGTFWLPLKVNCHFNNVTGKTRQVFSYTGSDQTFTVPSYVYSIFVKVWGAGGGSGTVGGWSYGAAGGGGGHTRGVIPVVPGETLTIVVGKGGAFNPSSIGYGGGGSVGYNSDNRYGGGGGGLSGIFRSKFTASDALLIAGGGGGGGSSRAYYHNQGGAGGGIKGQKGENPYDDNYRYSGGGGSQVAGGSSFGGGSGFSLTGGATQNNSYGGGGGGGYFGGGGGSYAESNTMAGGGGGSGYVYPGAFWGETFTGTFEMPAKYDDMDLPHDTGDGVGNAIPGYGARYYSYSGHGYCVIYY